MNNVERTSRTLIVAVEKLCHSDGWYKFCVKLKKGFSLIYGAKPRWTHVCVSVSECMEKASFDEF